MSCRLGARNRPNIDTESAPSRPPFNPTSTTDRLRFDPMSSPNRPRLRTESSPNPLVDPRSIPCIDPRSNPDSPRLDPEPGMAEASAAPAPTTGPAQPVRATSMRDTGAGARGDAHRSTCLRVAVATKPAGDRQATRRRVVAELLSLAGIQPGRRCHGARRHGVGLRRLLCAGRAARRRLGQGFGVASVHIRARARVRAFAPFCSLRRVRRRHGMRRCHSLRRLLDLHGSWIPAVALATICGRSWGNGQ